MEERILVEPTPMEVTEYRQEVQSKEENMEDVCVKKENKNWLKRHKVIVYSYCTVFSVWQSASFCSKALAISIIHGLNHSCICIYFGLT